jgi:hypothetical protein
MPRRFDAALAQLVEHRIRNAGVTGSSPVGGTIFPLLLLDFPSRERPKSVCAPAVINAVTRAPDIIRGALRLEQQCALVLSSDNGWMLSTVGEQIKP